MKKKVPNSIKNIHIHIDQNRNLKFSYKLTSFLYAECSYRLWGKQKKKNKFMQKYM